MRSVDEIRERKLSGLRRMIERPNAWALDGRAVQTLVQGDLSDLCFIDEQDERCSALFESLTRYGKLGVAGAFQAVFGEACNYTAEVASVFAEMAWSLGYLEPTRRLSELEWRSLISSVRTVYDEVDLRRSAVLERVGDASFSVGDRVLCYVGPNDSEWVAFDCWEEPVTRYVVEDGHFRHNFRTEREEDPLLRNVRVPAPSFNESLVLTTYGKVLRWGPGWWLHTQPARDLGTPEGVREQLQDINAGDPSQSLGPRRP